MKVRPLVTHKLPAESRLEDAACQVLKVLDVCFGSFIFVNPFWGCPLFEHNTVFCMGLLEVLRPKNL